MTQGPWQVIEDGNECRSIHTTWINPQSKNFDPVVTHVTFVDDQTIKTGTYISKPDANLIAAAPELLESLQNLIALVQNPEILLFSPSVYLDKAQQVIKKILI